MAEILGFTNLRYDTHYERCALDVFSPAADRHSPLVILIHGGGWIGGDRNQYHQSCVELANQGFAAATVGYRLLADANLDEIAYDVLRGMAYLSKHGSELGIDASRAVTLGSSAGSGASAVTVAYCTPFRPEKPTWTIPSTTKGVSAGHLPFTLKDCTTVFIGLSTS